MMQEILHTDFNPPLHFIILHFWMKVFGSSESSIRFVSLIFGVAALFMMYQLGKYLFNKEIGIVSALLLALSRPNIYYSQEARGYSLMLFLTLVSFYFFLQLRNKKNATAPVCYLVSSILLLYTHMFGMLIIITQTIYLVFGALLRDVQRDPHSRRWLIRTWPLYQLVLFIGYTPWIMVYIHKLAEARALAQQPLGWTLMQPSSAMIPAISTKLAGSSWLLVAMILCLALATLSTALNKRNLSQRSDMLTGRFISNGLEGVDSDNDKMLLLLIWIIAPTLLALIISVSFVPIIHYKYLLGLTPALYMLVAIGIRSVKPLAAKAAIVTTIIAFSFFNLWNYYNMPSKPDWRSVVASIEKRAAPGDFVIVSPAPNIQNGFSYYLRRNDLALAGFPEQGMLSEAHGINELQPMLEDRQGFWVAILIAHGENGLIDNAKALTQLLKTYYHIADRTSFDGIELYRCQRKQVK
ncbi:MAG: glycosyltransferase family 39 protein [Candidatus Aquicultor sp.]